MAMDKKAIEEYKKESQKNQEEVRKIVLEGLSKADKGELKPMDEVFDRLEEKYDV